MSADDKNILAVYEIKTYTILKFDVFEKYNGIGSLSEESLYVFVDLDQTVQKLKSEVFIRLYQSFLKLSDEDDSFLKNKFPNSLWDFNYDTDKYFPSHPSDDTLSKYYHINRSENENDTVESWNDTLLKHQFDDSGKFFRDALRIVLHHQDYVDYRKATITDYNLKQDITLNTQLNEYLKPEAIEEHYCSSWNTSWNVTKQISFQQCPKYLIINFHRFDTSNGIYRK